MIERLCSEEPFRANRNTKLARTIKVFPSSWSPAPRHCTPSPTSSLLFPRHLTLHFRISSHCGTPSTDPVHDGRFLTKISFAGFRFRLKERQWSQSRISRFPNSPSLQQGHPNQVVGALRSSGDGPQRTPTGATEGLLLAAAAEGVAEDVLANGTVLGCDLHVFGCEFGNL